MPEHQEKYISNLFDYHNPKNIDPKRFEEIRMSAKFLARSILNNGGTHRGSDIDIAIEKLRECVYYAIASIVVPN